MGSDRAERARSDHASGATCDVLANVGLVAIGRNEGERLRACLNSVTGRVGACVYVDSGSTDGSAELARALGVDVVALDLSVPFTAARARNAGFHRLIQILPNMLYVQFVDGDCTVADEWLPTAARRLDAESRMAVVCGRRRERHPGASVYNRLCDIEWDTPVGEARSCGGDAMFRVSAFVAAGQFDPALIAGEEPELCYRIRAAGGRVERIDAEMTLHDAAMTRLAQWFRRSLRAGYAYAQNAALHGRSPERFKVRETLRLVLWGGVLPALVAAGCLWSPWALAGLALYPCEVLRVAARSPRARGHRLVYALSCVAAKFPGFLGACRFAVLRMARREAHLIEYK